MLTLHFVSGRGELSLFSYLPFMLIVHSGSGRGELGGGGGGRRGGSVVEKKLLADTAQICKGSAVGVLGGSELKSCGIDGDGLGRSSVVAGSPDVAAGKLS